MPSSSRRRRSTSTGSSARRRRGAAPRPTATSTMAVDVLAEADALWRGDALAEFAYEDFAVGADRPAVRAPPRGHRGAARPRAAARTAPRRQSPSSRSSSPAHPLARAAPRAPDARALPRRTAGRRAARVPGRPPGARRGARARTRPRAPPAGGGDPRPGPPSRRTGGRRRPAAAPPEAALGRSPSRSPPLVGRDAELRELTRLVERAPPRHAGRARAGSGRPGWRWRSAGPKRTRWLCGGCLVELAPVGDPAGCERPSRPPSTSPTRPGSPR